MIYPCHFIFNSCPLPSTFPGNLCSEKAMDYMRTEGRTEDSHLADLKTEFGGGWIKKLRSRSKASITPQSTGQLVNDHLPDHLPGNK